MKQFLKENILWILAPVVVVGVGVLVLYFMGGDEGQAPFTYSLF
jgi:hypothetical protein